MIGLGQRELELLSVLVETEKAEPSQLFVGVYMQGGAFLAHLGTKRRNLGKLDVPALMALGDAGLLSVERYDDGRPAGFYLRSGAEEALNAAQERLGTPTPLYQAQDRIASLEAQTARTVAHHRTVAERVGKWARRGVLAVLILLVAGLAVWALLFSSLVPGVLAVIVAVYAVLTDAWGWTARAVAERIGAAVTRRVLAYLEPGP